MTQHDDAADRATPLPGADSAGPASPGPQRRPLTLEDLERMRVPVRYREVTFAGASAGAHREAVQKYLLGLDDMLARGVGLLFNGPNGTGKTSLAVVVLKEARRRGYTGLYIEAAMLRDLVFGKRGFDALESAWERMLSVDVLVLDDLGKGVQDSVAAEERLVDELLRHRGANRRVTLITTNLSAVARTPGSRSQLEEYLKASTLAMLQETVLLVSVLGPDLRAGSLTDLCEHLGEGARAIVRSPSLAPPTTTTNKR